MTTDLRALLDSLTDRCQPGPWRAEANPGVPGFWLENAAGDASFPTGEDVAAMLGALPALLGVAEAARAVLAAMEARGPVWLGEDPERDALDLALWRLDALASDDQGRTTTPVSVDTGTVDTRPGTAAWPVD